MKSGRDVFIYIYIYIYIYIHIYIHIICNIYNICNIYVIYIIYIICNILNMYVNIEVCSINARLAVCCWYTNWFNMCIYLQGYNVVLVYCRLNDPAEPG